MVRIEHSRLILADSEADVVPIHAGIRATPNSCPAPISGSASARTCGRIGNTKGDRITTHRFARSIGELDRVLTRVDEFCAEFGAGEGTVFAIRLVAEELFTNFVKYNRGGGDRIRLELDLRGGVIKLTLTDFDVEPFDVTGTPDVDVTLPAERREPGGLGLHLVKAYTDTFRYEYADRTMKVTVTKKLEAGDV